MGVVAVIGGGIRGLVSAYVVAKGGVDVVVYEKEEQLGGDAITVNFDATDLDLCFLFLNPASYATMLEMFDSLGVDVETSDVSFSVSHDKGNGYEWSSQYGFSNYFAQKKKLLNPFNWRNLREIIKFGNDVESYLELLENNPDIDRNETFGQFLKSRGYSENFQNNYLAPISGAMWSSSRKDVMSFSAFSVLSFWRTHHLYQLFGQPQWLTIRRHSYFVKRVRDMLESRGCLFKLACQVQSVLPADNGTTVVRGDGFRETYNGCILAVSASKALRLLENPTFEEKRVLGAFQYASSDIYLHRDSNLMPKDRSAWSALNFLNGRENKACLTYWLNALQKVGKTSQPFFLTVNPHHTPNDTLLKWSTSCAIPSVAASKGSLELGQIQGKRGIWFCGYDFHEDELKAGMDAAHGILGRHSSVVYSPKHLSPSFMETMACLFVAKFFQQYVSAGCIIFLEERGRIFTFKGNMEKCPLKSVLKVHNPQFYWRIMKEADLGLADAYINGDFSFVDKDKGLLNLFQILVVNKELNSAASGSNKRRTWLSPALFTASISSAKYFTKHLLRQNTVTQARRNISRHYDLGNELFTLYLGETMQYSSGVFKTGEEHLDVAQRRKISSLIEKTRIEKWHEVLDIGCGWGILAIEVVKRTGCKYTGITLSEKQLKYAEDKVKEAGLEGNIKLLLCDYRQLPKTNQYDRIISIEMVEHVGKEYIEEFYRCCDQLLKKDGLFVLQFITLPEELSKEVQQTAGFIKEYIFPGGLLLSFNTHLSAMAAASGFCVEHVENIGSSYYHTLRWWRKNFLENTSKVLALGFDDKFMRTWEYYFDYCAAGFKTGTLLDYQVVFSRADNFATLGDPYKGFPSAYSFMDT
ncbi:hypothetical protein E1A91_D10G096100v1 [Gossypium mustelinum]|uniref:Amine oxidase domain-containing protein n=1 Tax=Gossypium mustelinum TaxID=34275 RepID=A0A5D2T845_GOSMU|nr:hypothetical protein E1A91_D10G096100v1 [Gossypium mustelinum]